MSFDLHRWALQQRPPSPEAKSVLISLCDRANRQLKAWPSVARLEYDTLHTRKTVLKALRELRQHGYIAETGETKGKTGRVKVYHVCVDRPFTEAERKTRKKTVSKTTPLNSPREGSFNSVENDTIKQSPESTVKAANSPREGSFNSVENDTIKQSPESTVKAANSPREGSFNSVENDPLNHPLLNKTLGTIPESLEIVPKAPERKPATETPPGFDEFKIPDWLDPELWAAWENYRRNRIAEPWDDLAKTLSLGELHKANQRGQDLRMVIRNAVMRHFKHPYPLKSSVGADIPLDAIRDAYRRICVPAGMLECEEMYPELEALIARRVRDGGMTVGDWECFFQHAAKKPELTGKLPPRLGFDTPFRASLHSLLENKRFARLDAEIRTEIHA